MNLRWGWGRGWKHKWGEEGGRARSHLQRSWHKGPGGLIPARKGSRHTTSAPGWSPPWLASPLLPAHPWPLILGPLPSLSSPFLLQPLRPPPLKNHPRQPRTPLFPGQVEEATSHLASREPLSGQTLQRGRKPRSDKVSLHSVVTTFKGIMRQGKGFQPQVMTQSWCLLPLPPSWLPEVLAGLSLAACSRNGPHEAPTVSPPHSVLQRPPPKQTVLVRPLSGLRCWECPTPTPQMGRREWELWEGRPVLSARVHPSPRTHHPAGSVLS